jgi:hypothetical protein
MIPHAATITPPILCVYLNRKCSNSLQNGCIQLWQQASLRLIPARIHIEHAGHGFSTQNYKAAYDALLQFILTDY